jgi:hypothetical protein
MTYGPIEFVVLKFPGNQFSGEIVPALQELVDTGVVRIIDLLFVLKDGDGNVAVVEVDGLGDAVAAVLSPISQHEDELLSQQDGEHFGALLEPNSSAALLMFENAWATRFVQAVLNANGEVVLNERVPRDVIDAVLAEASDL